MFPGFLPRPQFPPYEGGEAYGELMFHGLKVMHTDSFIGAVAIINVLLFYFPNSVWEIVVHETAFRLL